MFAHASRNSSTRVLERLAIKGPRDGRARERKAISGTKIVVRDGLGGVARSRVAGAYKVVSGVSSGA